MESVLERKILPTSVRPSHYDIFFETQMDTFRFRGNVKISVKFMKNTDSIWLNVNQLEICSAHFADGKEQIPSTRIYVDELEEKCCFEFEKEFKKGTEGRLFIEYSGTILDKLAGYYRSEYTEDGQTRNMAVTQFEPTDARRAFPCWDEPNIKATFSISMRVEKRFTALSNMDVENIIDDGEWKIVNFMKTPVMSTYLVAFIVGEFDDVSTVARISEDKSIAVKIYTPIGYSSQAKFALDVATRTLEHFTKYLEIDYPLPKMDLVAIPDFGSGAMENWGLVTFRMTLLLVDEQESTIATRKRVTYVIAHELAHQWFGNLVTMDWWSDLWLNEGFATWMGWHASDTLFPEWDVWTEFYLDDSKEGLGLDSLVSSHPIEADAPDPSKIVQIFDSISYSKGASIIRMLASYLGPQDFQRGLTKYLREHQYGNAKTIDLWRAFENVSGKPVRDFMNGWTKSVGYPMVSVSRTKEGQILAKQKRFLLGGESGDDSNHVWTIPIDVITYNQRWCDKWMLDKESGQFSLEMDDVYNLNHNQTGFYRVLYPVTHFGKLCSTVSEQKGTISEYIGVLNDSFAFSISGHLSTTVALDLLKWFDGNTGNFFIWSEIASQLNRVQSLFYEEPEDIQKGLEEFIVRTFRRLKATHGWDVEENEDFHKLLLRTLVLSILVSNGDQESVLEARQQFEKLLTTDSSVHPNFKGFILSSAIKYGGEDEYNTVFQIYLDTKTPDQKILALMALTSTSDLKLVQKTLDYTLQDGPIRSQDAPYIYRGFSTNLKTRRFLWNYLRDHWKQYSSRFGKGSISLLRNIVSSAVGLLVRSEDAQEVEQFFRGVDVDCVSMEVEQSLEKVKIRSRWLQRDRTSISKWIKAV